MPHPESLAGQLQAPVLRTQKWELEKRIKDVPVNSPEFRQLRASILEIIPSIKMAEAADDLLVHQAMANLGFPI